MFLTRKMTVFHRNCSMGGSAEGSFTLIENKKSSFLQVSMSAVQHKCGLMHPTLPSDHRSSAQNRAQDKISWNLCKTGNGRMPPHCI